MEGVADGFAVEEDVAGEIGDGLVEKMRQAESGRGSGLMSGKQGGSG